MTIFFPPPVSGILKAMLPGWWVSQLLCLLFLEGFCLSVGMSLTRLAVCSFASLQIADCFANGFLPCVLGNYRDRTL